MLLLYIPTKSQYFCSIYNIKISLEAENVMFRPSNQCTDNDRDGQTTLWAIFHVFPINLKLLNQTIAHGPTVSHSLHRSDHSQKHCRKSADLIINFSKTRGRHLLERGL